MENEIPTNLIIRYLSNEATTEEAEKLLNWVAADRSHQKIFDEWMETWNYKFPHDPPFELSVGLKVLNNRIDKYESETKVNAMFPWARVAVASLVVLVLSAMVVSIRFTGPDSVPLSEFKTSPGMIDTIFLEDGSKVVLNENTSLKYPKEFNGSTRKVSIEGEAFFEVKKDTERPFIVETGGLTTQVLGTSFNIRNRAGKVTVAVATGKVSVSKDNSVTLLLPAEKVTYSIKQKMMVKENANLTAELNWRNPPLRFIDTPLSEVTVRLQQHYGIPIILESKTLANCLITGKFKNEPLDKVLSAICFSTGTQVRRSGDQYILSGGNCSDDHPK